MSKHARQVATVREFLQQYEKERANDDEPLDYELADANEFDDLFDEEQDDDE